jgi:hypothetical protein
VTEYRITVGAKTKRGWRNMHTFVWNESTQRWIPALGWLFEKTMLAADAASRKADGQFDRDRFVELAQSPKYKQDERRRAARLDALTDPSAPFKLATNVKVPMPILSFIFDALRASNEHSIDIYAINAVVSQQGSRISAIHGLGECERRHATDELHRLIMSAVLASKRL